MKPEDFIETADKINDIVEEPVGNTNAVANYILSKKVEEKYYFLVTVEMKYLQVMIGISQFIK